MRPERFFIRPFSCDGQPVGSGFWQFADLSERWLLVCNDLHHEHAGTFDTDWRGNLSHIRTKFTSATGAAVATFFVHGVTAASALMLSGACPTGETEITGLFVESVKRTASACDFASEVDSLVNIASAAERPIMALVTWPNQTVADADHGLVLELTFHLAGAFFLRNASETA